MRMHRLTLPFVPLVIACAADPLPPPAAATPAPVAPSPAPVAPLTPLKGAWLATLETGVSALRLQLRMDLEANPPRCIMDSIDQGNVPIPCTAKHDGSALKIDVPSVAGEWDGKVTLDGATLNGTWTQGVLTAPLAFTKEDKPFKEPVKEDPAMPPVGIDSIQAILDSDIAAALANGELAPKTDNGVTIGVTLHGVRRIWSYGTVKPDSLFEVGSITKTFTGLALAQMVEQKKARLDEPVRELLPAGTVDKPPSGAEITLLDLSAQHSGLPRLPENLKPLDASNPYADYDDKALYAFVAKHGVGLPPNTQYLYSNLGVGLLGNVLAHRAGLSYEALVAREITGPLGMHETVGKLPPALAARFAQGHDPAHRPARGWDQDALAGAGLLRSSAADMLTYLEAQLHPEKLGPKVTDKTIAAAITASHVLHGDAGDGQHIALGWFQSALTGNYWHNGATGGYSAYAVFSPASDYAVIVLSNTTAGTKAFADKVGKHVSQRLAGRAAVYLGP